ncbi:hypothetical protein J2Z50_003326 [Ensifer mexicanus]|nr:hypothetical protein [Sinorhizobium mexicanum]
MAISNDGADRLCTYVAMRRLILIGFFRAVGARGFTYVAYKFIDSESKFNILVDRDNLPG